MVDKNTINELGERLAAALRQSPLADVEKNARAVLLSFFDRLDLVSREDFDVQKALLEKALARLSELEKRVAELDRDAAAS